MNPSIRLSNIGIIALLLVVMMNTDVSAQMQGGTHPEADLDQWTSQYCSESSIAGSKSALDKAFARRRGMSNILTAPDVEMLSVIETSLRVIALENLIVSCAILKALDKGV